MTGAGRVVVVVGDIVVVVVVTTEMSALMRAGSAWATTRRSVVGGLAVSTVSGEGDWAASESTAMSAAPAKVRRVRMLDIWSPKE